jgi:hypothetical protein
LWFITGRRISLKGDIGTAMGPVECQLIRNEYERFQAVEPSTTAFRCRRHTFTQLLLLFPVLFLCGLFISYNAHSVQHRTIVISRLYYVAYDQISIRNN